MSLLNNYFGQANANKNIAPVHNVINQAISRKNMQVDLSELNSGTYILRVTTANQSGVYKLNKK